MELASSHKTGHKLTAHPPTGSKKEQPNSLIDRDNFLRGDPSNARAVICKQSKPDAKSCSDWVNAAPTFCKDDGATIVD